MRTIVDFVMRFLQDYVATIQKLERIFLHTLLYKKATRDNVKLRSLLVEKYGTTYFSIYCSNYLFKPNTVALAYKVENSKVCYAGAIITFDETTGHASHANRQLLLCPTRLNCTAAVIECLEAKEFDLKMSILNDKSDQ